MKAILGLSISATGVDLKDQLLSGDRKLASLHQLVHVEQKHCLCWPAFLIGVVTGQLAKSIS
jgi:hypothetical protein